MSLLKNLPSHSGPDGAFSQFCVGYQPKVYVLLSDRDLSPKVKIKTANDFFLRRVGTPKKTIKKQESTKPQAKGYKSSGSRSQLKK